MDASNPHPFSLDPIGGVFRTVDGGATWHAVSDGLNPLFLSLSVRMDLSVSQTKDSLQPNYPLYAAVIGPGSHGGELREIYRSNDLGATWTQMSLPGDSNGGINASEQGFLHFSLLADPNDPNIVYAGGDTHPNTGFPNATGAEELSGRLFRGDFRLAGNPATVSDIGVGWTSITDNYAQGTAPHADSRSLAFDARGGLIEVDDGGIYRLTNALPYLDRAAAPQPPVLT
jgi:hypothetical protein